MHIMIAVIVVPSLNCGPRVCSTIETMGFYGLLGQEHDGDETTAWIKKAWPSKHVDIDKQEDFMYIYPHEKKKCLAP